jgi:tetratricopeptide (TPR) repeat protein
MTIVVVVLVGGDPVSDAHDLLKEERFEEAAAAFDSLLVDYPDDTDFLRNSAICHAACREFEAAAVSMETYIGLRPDDARGYVMLGAIRYGQGLIYEGKRLLAIADSLEPGILERWME